MKIFLKPLTLDPNPHLIVSVILKSVHEKFLVFSGLQIYLGSHSEYLEHYWLVAKIKYKDRQRVEKKATSPDLELRNRQRL